MNHLKTLVSTAVLALTLSALAVGPASATVLTDGSATQLKTGTSIAAESEGNTILHPPIGSLECEESDLGGKTTNDGGAGVNISINVETLSWSKCNATYTVLQKGMLSIAATGGGNGTLTSSGTELTTVMSGFHCIFKTNNTKLGTLTGSANTKGNATLDIEATIPRTGGSSGIFCGSTAQWTGSYIFTAPSVLNID